MKTCKKCLVEKPETEFKLKKGNSDGRTGSCKKCFAAKARALYSVRKHLPEFLEHNRVQSRKYLAKVQGTLKYKKQRQVWGQAQRKKSPKYREQNWSRYGITTVEGDVFKQNHFEKALVQQGRACGICFKELYDMTGKNVLRACVDHNHKTNVFRGILCHKCNAALGLFSDCKEAVAAAVKYLE
jgi:hypothetical protein